MDMFGGTGSMIRFSSGRSNMVVKECRLNVVSRNSRCNSTECTCTAVGVGMGSDTSGVVVAPRSF